MIIRWISTGFFTLVLQFRKKKHSFKCSCLNSICLNYYWYWQKQTPWPSSASKLYRPSDRRFSAKLVPTFADRGCCVVSATDPHHGCILGFLDRSRYYFFQVAPHLRSEGWVDSVPDPLLLRICGSGGNRTRVLSICSQELWPLDHRGGLLILAQEFYINKLRICWMLFEHLCHFCSSSIQRHKEQVAIL
jgi:hypothetical protein